jgi:2-dehydro-3-deoxy-D-arabinonate dehydratase
VPIVRYRTATDADPKVGWLAEDGVRRLAVSSLGQLWGASAPDRAALLEAPTGPAVPLADVQLLAPVDGRTEVWACGVTYEKSRDARVEESERAADVYELVYDAERPELFFKSVSWRVAGPDAPIGVRADSEMDVPEPELALVVSAAGDIVGYTICNDVSSRTIEGVNPLYLPQAKVYQGACALGPWIQPLDAVTDPYQLAITLEIERGGQTEWSGTANTSQLHRRLPDLVEFLMRGDSHPDGAVLATGTCLVPDPPFTLATDDVVSISIEQIGTLRNPVIRGRWDATDAR